LTDKGWAYDNVPGISDSPLGGTEVKRVRADGHFDNCVEEEKLGILLISHLKTRPVDGDERCVYQRQMKYDIGTTWRSEEVQEMG